MYLCVYIKDSWVYTSASNSNKVLEQLLVFPFSVLKITSQIWSEAFFVVVELRFKEEGVKSNLQAYKSSWQFVSQGNKSLLVLYTSHLLQV
jgi:hypothetical protein